MQLAATSYYRFTSFARMLIPSFGLYLAAPDSTNGAPNAAPFPCLSALSHFGQKNHETYILIYNSYTGSRATIFNWG